MLDQLLTLLSENARLSCAQLAAMLNKTEAQVQEEIAAYEKAGIIRGYQTQINRDKVDSIHASALIKIKGSPKKDKGFDDMADRIMQLEEVESVYLMSGGFDLAVCVNGRSMQEIAMFVARKLSPMDSVLSTATHFILKRYKDGGLAMESEDEIDERRSMFGD